MIEDQAAPVAVVMAEEIIRDQIMAMISAEIVVLGTISVTSMKGAGVATGVVEETTDPILVVEAGVVAQEEVDDHRGKTAATADKILTHRLQVIFLLSRVSFHSCI